MFEFPVKYAIYAYCSFKKFRIFKTEETSGVNSGVKFTPAFSLLRERKSVLNTCISSLRLPYFSADFYIQSKTAENKLTNRLDSAIIAVEQKSAERGVLWRILSGIWSKRCCV